MILLKHCIDSVKSEIMKLKIKNSGYINKIIPVSAVDGPGNRLIFFLQGCSLNCKYCHNPETINYCSSCGKCLKYCKNSALEKINNTIKYNIHLCKVCGKCIKNCPSLSSPKYFEMDLTCIEKIINLNRDFISGITVSGGEPTMQSEFTAGILKSAKNIKISAFLNTNCNCNISVIKFLEKYFDYAMIDIKAFDSAEHKKLTGSDNKMILQNAAYLLKKKSL